MINLPQIVKAERDLTGAVSIRFKGEDGEFENSFRDIRAGVSWPIKALKGYMCIVGLLSATSIAGRASLMLIYEKEYGSYTDLLADAYNKAHDLRFNQFYTDTGAVDWQGFCMEFNRRVKTLTGAQAIRLHHSYMAHDFRIGLDTVNRLGAAGSFVLPKTGILAGQLKEMRPESLDVDRPEHHFNAINGFRYVVMEFERERSKRVHGKAAPAPARTVDVKGWA
jgi:hypothetical protein